MNQLINYYLFIQQFTWLAKNWLCLLVASLGCSKWVGFDLEIYMLLDSNISIRCYGSFLCQNPITIGWLTNMINKKTLKTLLSQLYFGEMSLQIVKIYSNYNLRPFPCYIVHFEDFYSSSLWLIWNLMTLPNSEKAVVVIIKIAPNPMFFTKDSISGMNIHHTYTLWDTLLNPKPKLSMPQPAVVM